MSAQDVERGLAAPEILGLETRVEIRQAAAQLLEGMPEGSGRLIIDLMHTREVDSAGLGALMLIQRMAAERLESLLRDAFPDAGELRVEDRTGGGDHFLKTLMPQILSSQAYRSGKTAVFVVWDEDSYIPNIAIAPSELGHTSR